MGALYDVLVGLSVDETNRAANKIIASEVGRMKSLATYVEYLYIL